MSSRWRKDPSVWLAFLLSCVITVGFVVDHFTLVDRVQSNCQSLNGLKTLIVTQLTQQAYKLGSPGTAGYAYYTAHPTELIAARNQQLTFIKSFEPHGCS